jgi:site-specific recombinase XerD
MNDIQIYDANSQIELVVEAVLNGVGKGSRPVYAGAISAFREWSATNPHENAYSSLLAYRRYMEDRGLQNATINRHLSALRRFFETAYHMNQLPESVWKNIQEVKNIHVQGQKRGNWLSFDQAQALLKAPDITTFKGLRDRAILAVMLGCGLRRSEVSGLRGDHLVQREGVWFIENLLGKHNRTRTIPLQEWVVQAVLQYIMSFTNSNVPSGRLFWSIDRHGNWHSSISSQAIWLIVLDYAKKIGVEKLTPHDLRRTYAELLRRSGGNLEEVQALLGHSSLAVTQRYLSQDVDPDRISRLIQLEL